MGGIPDLDMNIRGKCSHCGEEFRTWDWIRHMQQVDGSGPIMPEEQIIEIDEQGKVTGDISGLRNAMSSKIPPSKILEIGDELNQCLQIIVTNAGNIKDRHIVGFQIDKAAIAIEDAGMRAAKAVRRLAEQ